MATRNLYLTNLPIEEALARFRQALDLGAAPAQETVGVVESLSRVTAEAIYARYNSPLYDCAAMDGIAVVSAATRGASESSPVKLTQGRDFVPVDTGDPVNPPFDAVIMAEDLQELEDDNVQIRAAAAPWQHIRPVGEDIVTGEMILSGGHTIRPMDVGVLLSGGITQIPVRVRPRVAIFPTGTELVEPGEELKEGAIVESNSRMFEALVIQAGAIPVRFDTLPDDYEVIKTQIREAADHYDIVLVSAGTSAGREDYTVPVMRELGEVVAHGVAMKPGKPVALAVINGKPVVGIPGYPVSAYLAFENFVAPILADRTGRLLPASRTVRATLARRLVSSLKYREYVRVKAGRIGSRLVASPLARGAGAAMSMVRADGFCVIGQDCEGVEAGDEVEVTLFRSEDELEGTVVCIGSHDLILDVLADLLPNRFPGTSLSSTHVGSMGGLLALQSGEAHIAPTHLLDEETGSYNVPVIRELFGDRPMALVKGVGRVQGIMVAGGNPLGISGVADLVRCRYINRQRGSGTRVFLDYQLKAAGVDEADIVGYDREAATHMAVVAAIQGGSADAGMGVLSAANAMNLDFIPIGNEEYDFALPADFLDLPHIRSFIEVLKDPAFLDKLEELGGYTAEHCGEIVIIGEDGPHA